MYVDGALKRKPAIPLPIPSRMRLYHDLDLLHVFALVLSVASLLVYPCLADAQLDEAGSKELVQWINQERASQGIAPLTVDQRLTQAARKHTSLMVEHQAPSHQFEGESTTEIRFADENLRSDEQAENVDVSKDVPSAHQGFMRSPPHRANILSPNYNVIGVAVIRSGEHVYVTEDFAHRVTAYSEPEADALLQRAIETYATAHGMSPPVRKPQAQLRHMACDMALNDSLQTQKAADLPGVQEVAAWTAVVPGDLPSSTKELLSHPMPSGYSLGACFAPSVSQPGGVYWVIMVTY